MSDRAGAGAIWKRPSSRCLEKEWPWGELWCCPSRGDSPPCPLPFYVSIPNSGPEIKTAFNSRSSSLRLQMLSTRTCSERSKDLAGQLKSSLPPVPRSVQHAGLLLGSPLGGDKSELCYRGWGSGKAALCCWCPPLHPVPMSHW